MLEYQESTISSDLAFYEYIKNFNLTGVKAMKTNSNDWPRSLLIRHPLQARGQQDSYETEL